MVRCETQERQGSAIRRLLKAYAACPRRKRGDRIGESLPAQPAVRPVPKEVDFGAASRIRLQGKADVGRNEAVHRKASRTPDEGLVSGVSLGICLA